MTLNIFRDSILDENSPGFSSEITTTNNYTSVVNYSFKLDYGYMKLITPIEEIPVGGEPKGQTLEVASNKPGVGTLTFVSSTDPGVNCAITFTYNENTNNVKYQIQGATSKSLYCKVNIDPYIHDDSIFISINITPQ